jgi:kojibiose phosphorylase
MVFLTARFWASRVVHAGEHYEIRCVIGPDEFHEHVNNNAYTNFLVKWHLRLAVTLFRYMGRNNSRYLDELASRLTLNSHEVDSWFDIGQNLKLSYDSESKLFEQFDSYFALKDYVIEKDDREGQPVLPRGINYRNIQSTRLIKQADVISMMMLFPHAFSFEQKQANFDFYEKRTAHKSSLSHCIHAMVGLPSGRRSRAYDYFMKTAQFDLENLHGNTALGIHAAAVGGTWQTVIYGFGGLSIKSERLVLKPWLPNQWQSLSFSVRWKTRVVEFTIYQEKVSVLIRSEEQISLPLSLFGKTHKLKTNQRYDLPDERKCRRECEQ